MDGKCNNLTALSLTSEAIANISLLGLNFTEEMVVVKFKTIFSGVGLVLLQQSFLLYTLTTPEFDPQDKYLLLLEIARAVPLIQPSSTNLWTHSCCLKSPH